MSQLISTKTVVARKDHRCYACDAVAVSRGDEYARETYVYDGRIYALTVCQPCSALTNAVWQWSGGPCEGIAHEDYLYWAEQHVDDERHGQAAKAWLDRARVAS